MRRIRAALAAALFVVLPVAGQQTETIPPVVPPQNPPVAAPAAPAQPLGGFLEVGGDYHGLSNGFGVWNGGYWRSLFSLGDHNFNAEVTGQREFDDIGIYLGAGDSYTFTPNWYGSVNVGTSLGGFFYPRVRADAFINRKLLARKQFIVNFGAGYYAAKDVHRDYSFSGGAVYYFAGPWIFETGARFNISTPGRVFSPSGFVALTQGRNKQHYVVVRAGFAREAYQIIGPAAVLSDFVSQDFGLTWRQWVGKNWGINAVGQYYHNPSYERGGISFGIFKDF
jgi:YaiO family outer membrane protein